MERKIGETFEFEGKTLRVIKQSLDNCDECFLRGRCIRENRQKTGYCEADDRTDKMDVVFAEVENEEPTEQPAPKEETKLNLCEKLKYCPEGTQFWSPLINTVTFSRIDKRLVFTKSADGTEWDFNADSTITFTFNGSKTMTSQEPMLFPSREQRDWSKVKYETPVDKLPKTWDEFVRGMGFNPEKFTFDGLYMELSDSMLAGGDDIGRYCDQHIAMVQLHALRDCYRQGWKPDDKNVDGKSPYAITCVRTMGGLKPHIGIYAAINRFLSFQDEEHARLFLKCFEDIIKEAGDLI